MAAWRAYDKFSVKTNSSEEARPAEPLVVLTLTASNPNTSLTLPVVRHRDGQEGHRGCANGRGSAGRLWGTAGLTVMGNHVGCRGRKAAIPVSAWVSAVRCPPQHSTDSPAACPPPHCTAHRMRKAPVSPQPLRSPLFKKGSLKQMAANPGAECTMDASVLPRGRGRGAVSAQINSICSLRGEGDGGYSGPQLTFQRHCSAFEEQSLFLGGRGCDEHWMLPKKGATSTSRQHPSSCVMGTTKQNQQYTKMEPADKASRVRSPTSFAFTADLNILCTDCGNRRRQLAAGLLTVVPHRGDEKHCHEP